MLRGTVLAQVYKSLSVSKYFRADDFELTQFLSEEGRPTLLINYRFEEQYCFRSVLSFDHDGGSMMQVECTPGDLMVTESFFYAGTSEFLQGIVAWTQRLQQELEVTPLHRSISDQQSQIDALLASVGEIPNDYFTRDEADELKLRLDKLERDLATSAKESISDPTKLEKKLESIHADIQELKDRTHQLKKSGWFKAASVKLLDWSKDPANRALLSNGYQVVRSLLVGPGASSQPPSDAI